MEQTSESAATRLMASTPTSPEEPHIPANMEPLQVVCNLASPTSALTSAIATTTQPPPTNTILTTPTTTTMPSDNVLAASDAIIDLCNVSPTPSTSKSAAAAAAATPITLDSSGDEEVVVDGNEAAPQAADDAATGTAATIECPICLQTCIHPARLPCGHIFCFLCVKGVAYKNRRCAMCRREIPPEFLDHPDLVNGIDDICATKSTEDGYQWFYEGRNGWWQYDDRTSQDIEEAFKKGEKSCIILVAGYVYVVDLEAMVQQRQNEPIRCRRVKRDLATIPKKGVAGLRIEGNTVITDSNFASQVQQQQQQRNIIIGISAANTPLDPTNDFSPPLNFYSLRHPTNASDFITTIAATDAAIRIASDIIGSTLAHADELSRAGGAAATTADSGQQNTEQLAELRVGDNSVGGYSGNYRPLIGSNTARQGTTLRHGSVGSVPALTSPTSSAAANAHAHALVAHGSRELLDAAEDLLDATQNVISEADQQTIDLFEQTLNDFHALTLRNIIDSDSDETENHGGGVRRGGGAGGDGAGSGVGNGGGGEDDSNSGGGGGGSGVGGGSGAVDADVNDDHYAPQRHIRF